MARSRNIKPGFFRNAELVELPYETRLLFAGLWIIADRDGRLEDRPKQIKMDVFPADTLDIDAMLDQLHKSGLVIRYESNSKRYVQIVTFKKHQNPHIKEPASVIPAPCEHQTSTIQTPVNNSAELVSTVLIPDSLLLIPDSKTIGVEEQNVLLESFELAWKAYPSRPGSSKADSLKAWKKRVKDGADPAAIIAGVSRYAAYCKASETEPQYIKQPATFFGPGEHYLSDWTPPSRASPRMSPSDASKLSAARTIFGTEIEGNENAATGRIIDITPAATRSVDSQNLPRIAG